MVELLAQSSHRAGGSRNGSVEAVDHVAEEVGGHI
jgi:hypothetical protein